MCFWCSSTKKLALCLGLLISTIPVLTDHAFAEVPNHISLRAGYVLDVETGELQTDQAIEIVNGKIIGVDPVADSVVPDHVVQIELLHATVLPGMIDAHTHLTQDWRVEGMNDLPAARRALVGARNARTTLLAGFTSVRDVGAEGFSDVALRDAIDAGDVIGPRMIASGDGVGLPYVAECNSNSEWDFWGWFDDADDYAAQVRDNARCGADGLKIMASGSVVSPGAKFTQEEMTAMVRAAHELGQKVTAHAQSSEAIISAVEAGVDSIEHAIFIDDAAISAMKEHGTFLVPTVHLGYWIKNGDPDDLPFPQAVMFIADKVIASQRENIGRAVASGVKVVLGTDFGRQLGYAAA